MPKTFPDRSRTNSESSSIGSNDPLEESQSRLSFDSDTGNIVLQLSPSQIVQPADSQRDGNLPGKVISATASLLFYPLETKKGENCP